MDSVCRAVVLAVVLLAVAARPAHADLIYTYTSLPFFFVTGEYRGLTLPNPVTDDGTADRITGSFVLSDSFVTQATNQGTLLTPGIVSYAFSDGHQTLTQMNSIGNFIFSWGPAGPVVWDGALTYADRNVLGRPRLDWSISISSPTGSIQTWALSGGSDLFEAASSNGTAPSCAGGGFEIDHGGTNGGTSCEGGNNDRGVDTSQLASWSWTVQDVQATPEPATLLLVGLGALLATPRLRQRVSRRP